MGAICRSTAFLGILYLLATPLSAQYIPPITDLDLYSMLAPCAASAISENISKFSSKSACPTGDRQLQSCVCSQSELLSQVSRNVSAAVLRDCGSSATDDTWSASKALELYCSPGATITFLTPTTNIVDARITNVPEFSLLAGCAQFAIQYGLMYDVRILPNTISLQQSQWRIRTNCVQVTDNCPTAPSLYAPCVCSKSDVVETINKSLSTVVFASCNNKEDASIAVEFYSQYCAMNQGTTSFALHTPPGDSEYSIARFSINSRPQLFLIYLSVILHHRSPPISSSWELCPVRSLSRSPQYCRRARHQESREARLALILSRLSGMTAPAIHKALRLVSA